MYTIPSLPKTMRDALPDGIAEKMSFTSTSALPSHRPRASVIVAGPFAAAGGVFAGGALFTKEFSTNPEQRKTSMKELIAQSSSLGNHSAVFDALHQALSLFGEHQPGDTILLMSHPSDFHSHRNGVDLEKEFLSRGTRLLFIFKPFNPAKGLGAITEYSNLRELKRLVSATGGMYTTHRNKDILSFAWAGYLLELKLPVAQLAERLTLAGLEVGGVRVVGLPVPEGLRIKSDELGPVWQPDKIVIRYVVEQVFEGSSAILLRIFDLLAKLAC